MRDHALRQVVGLDLVGDGQMLQLRPHEAPMAADDTPDHSFMAEMIEAALAVALSRRMASVRSRLPGVRFRHRARR